MYVFPFSHTATIMKPHSRCRDAPNSVKRYGLVCIFFACSTSSKAGKFHFGETYPQTYLETLPETYPDTDPSFLSFYVRREVEKHGPKHTPKTLPKIDLRNIPLRQTSRLGHLILRYGHISKLRKTTYARLCLKFARSWRTEPAMNKSWLQLWQFVNIISLEKSFFVPAGSDQSAQPTVCRRSWRSSSLAGIHYDYYATFRRTYILEFRGCSDRLLQEFHCMISLIQ